MTLVTREVEELSFLSGMSYQVRDMFGHIEATTGNSKNLLYINPLAIPGAIRSSMTGGIALAGLLRKLLNSSPRQTMRVRGISWQKRKPWP